MKEKFKRRLKRVLIWSLIISAVLFIVYLILFKTTLLMSDIRPEKLKGNYTLQNDGMAYLENAQSSHGMTIWQEYDSIFYEVETEFVDMKAWFMISPVSEDQITYKYVCQPGNLERSIYHSVKPESEFLISKDKKGIFVKLENDISYDGFGSTFFYRAVQHLIQFPYTMNSANIKEYVGTRKWNGQYYDLIFATWGTMEPNLTTDQYIIWINKNTGLIDRFDATGRDLTPWAIASVRFEYEEKGGLIYPTSAKVINKESGKAIMNFKIKKCAPIKSEV